MPAWLVVVLSLTAPGHAREDTCRALEPERRLSAREKRAVDAAIEGAIADAGRVARGGPPVPAHDLAMASVWADALARSWYLHQACVLREAGLIDASTGESLARQLVGAGPGRPAAGAAPADAVSADGDPGSDAPAPVPVGGSAPRSTMAGPAAIWYGSSLATAGDVRALGWWAVESPW